MDKTLLKKLGKVLLENSLLNELVPNPDNHPPILYKYRNWSNDYHKNLLIKNEIFMSPPNMLNDPFDCRIYTDYIKYLKNPNQKEKYINDSLLRYKDYFTENNICITQARNTLEERLNDLLYYQVRSEVIKNENDNKIYWYYMF